MAGFRLSAKALDDLRAIASFTEQRWGRKQRNRYLKQLDNAFHWLAAQPALGSGCSEIRAGYRKYPQGSHLIFYRTGGDKSVEVTRILHKSMDVPARLWE
ncbi:type II toxin-antitoxin system RelE/ParE family toxin [Salinisphaera sp.]|uniref:type II toxin-antitoxin system RelE/ParE family toxin n=1 Tax=Salinisphaera sp. TaxID=1914330 RepID=UPI002D766708|nr:type II toxin-antitoxin system RelE/ParE family toxin [Salinisphaera sp.]HET7312838.1 type II toxin-antitoxin system RelE/ParE family toxin [Salinisphaera sp.]